MEVVQVILESILLRREKDMLDSDGKRIVQLPPKEVRLTFRISTTVPLKSPQIKVETLEFSPLERKIYDSLYSDAKKNFENLNEKGLVSRNYTHILAMLMRFVILISPSVACLNDSDCDAAFVGRCYIQIWYCPQTSVARQEHQAEAAPSTWRSSSSSSARVRIRSETAKSTQRVSLPT